jgi:hypothetical protein
VILHPVQLPFVLLKPNGARASRLQPARQLTPFPDDDRHRFPPVRLRCGQVFAPQDFGDTLSPPTAGQGMWAFCQEPCSDGFAAGLTCR